MALLKRIKFDDSITPIAQTQVAINNDSSNVLSVVGTNTGLDVEENPLYTIALAVDGKTITKTGNDGLATSLQLKYHAPVTTEGSEKGAYIALEDNTGASISGSEVMVADIIGNGILKSSSYNETTGILTLTFATASGTDTTVDINLGELFDIDDIIIKQDSVDYLSFNPADPSAETGQAVLGVKLADVTYTPASGGTPANLEVSTANGKMLAADDAIPAIKGYIDNKITDLDVDDVEVAGKYVSQVSETDGKISVVRKDVSGAALNNYAKGTDELPLAATDTINQAFSKIEVTIEKNENVTATALNSVNARIDEIAEQIQYKVTGTTLEFFGMTENTGA